MFPFCLLITGWLSWIREPHARRQGLDGTVSMASRPEPIPSPELDASTMAVERQVGVESSASYSSISRHAACRIRNSRQLLSIGMTVSEAALASAFPTLASPRSCLGFRYIPRASHERSR
jgi:hypothetical protein